MASKAEVLAAYRSLLKATRKSFTGDTPMLSESEAEIRRRFENNQSVALEAEVRRLLDETKEASHFITRMIVQTKLGFLDHHRN